MLDMISVVLTFLRPALWPSMWSVIKYIASALEKNVPLDGMLLFILYTTWSDVSFKVGFLPGCSAHR